MKKVYFAEVGVIDDYLYSQYGEDADGMTHRDLTDEEFKKVSTGIAYDPMGYFNVFNNGSFVPDPDNFFCRIIEETDSTEDKCINYYEQMRDIENDCTLNVIAMLNALGGSHEFSKDDNTNLVLPYIDSNGDACNVVIDKIELRWYKDEYQYLVIYTDEGISASTSDFTDCSIIFIYEALYTETH